MTTQSPEARIARLERRVAALEREIWPTPKSTDNKKKEKKA